LYEIYLITNQITGKIYVGQTRRGLSLRFSDHKKDARRGSDQYIHKSIRYYGEKYFTICRLASGGETQESANEAERFWVLRLCCNDPKIGYNLSSGGGQGRVLTEVARKKIGDACRKPNTPEQKCIGCGLVKPLEEFYINNAISNGRMSRCIKCTLETSHQKYQETEGLTRAKARERKRSATTRLCSGCSNTKSLDEFHKSKNTPGGHSYICKECRSRRRRKATVALKAA
jgi:group I intron endonuclease